MPASPPPMRVWVWNRWVGAGVVMVVGVVGVVLEMEVVKGQFHLDGSVW